MWIFIVGTGVSISAGSSYKMVAGKRCKSHKNHPTIQRKLTTIQG